LDGSPDPVDVIIESAVPVQLSTVPYTIVYHFVREMSRYYEPATGRGRRRSRLRARAARRRRLVAAGGAAVLLAAVGLALALSQTGSEAQRARHEPSRSAVARRPARATRASARPATSPRHALLSPGLLPQTHSLPSARGAQFKARMASLWNAIVDDSVASARGAFFPESAYLQVKAIAAAGADWRDRLMREFALDIEVAHAQLGRVGKSHLVAVNVGSDFAHWVTPGTCYNRVGYYELPGSRIVYSTGGRLHSFGIASMISWRGQWYVVHLGAVVRPGEGGVVDEPALGPGEPADSGTC
jgi:hypothetical protein